MYKKSLVILLSIFIIFTSHLAFSQNFDGAIPTAYATPKEIVLPFPICLSIPYICHEMAHVVNYQLWPVDHHGPNFSTTYLRIVKKFMGTEAFIELRKAFETTRVRYDFNAEFVIDVEIDKVDKRVAV